MLPPAALDDARVAARPLLVALCQRGQQLVQLPVRLYYALRLGVRVGRALQEQHISTGAGSSAPVQHPVPGASVAERAAGSTAAFLGNKIGSDPPTFFASVTALSAIRLSSLALASVVWMRSL